MKTARLKLFLLFSCLYYFLPLLQAQGNCPGVTAQLTTPSIQNLCAGSSVNLQAAGSYSFYQWQKQTTAGGPFVDISGANGASYQTSIVGAYRVVVGNGTCTDTSGISNVVQISLEGGTISGVTSPICAGENSGMITGTEVPGSAWGLVTFTWQVNVNNAGWTMIPNATDLNYFGGAVNQPMSFRRVASDNCGNSVFSNVYTITPTPVLMPGSIAPAVQNLNSAQTPATLTSVTPASGGSGNLRYQWQFSYSETNGFMDIAGATSASYSPGPLNRTSYFKRLVIDNKCATVKETPVVAIFISDAILDAGGIVSSSICVFPGGQASMLESNLPPSGGTPPYQIAWQSSTDNITFTTIPGATGNTYQPGSITQNTWFRKRVTDATNAVVYSPAEMLTLVTTPLTPGSIMASNDITCLGVTPGIIRSTGSPTGYGEKLRYQWQYRTATNLTWIDMQDEIRENVIPIPIVEKTWFRRLAMDVCGQNSRTAISNEVVIDVKPELFPGDIQPGTQTIAKNGIPMAITSSAAPSGGTGSYTVSWQQANLAVGPWTDIANSSGLDYQPGALSNTTYYRRRVEDNNCLALKYSFAVEVIVSESPAIYPGIIVGSTCVFPGDRPGELRTGGPNVSGGTPPYQFQWQMRTASNPFADIAGATSENYRPDFITQNTDYRRRVTDALGQVAYSDTVTIRYWNTVLMPGSLKVNSSVVCAGSPVGVIEGVTSMSGFGEAAMYQWQMSTNGTNWTDIPGQVRENYNAGNISQTTYFRRAASDKCVDVRRWVYSNVVVVTVAAPVAFKSGLVDGPFITCAGTAPGTINSVLDACGTGTVQYQWEMNNGGGWNTIAGANSASYTPGVINSNTSYRRRAMDACGQSGYSNTVEIFVYPPIEPGVIGNTLQVVCANDLPGVLRLETDCHYTDGTVTYQWQRATSMAGPWNNIGGATSSTYQPMGAATTMYYRLEVRSTTCSFVAHTNVATVQVDANCRGAAIQEVTSLYPNPISHSTFTIKRKTEGRVNVVVRNTEGVVVPVSLRSIGHDMLRVDFNRVPSKGMYAVTVMDESGVYTLKLLVQ